MIEEVDLWEISVVTFPMNESSRIASVKAGAVTIDELITRFNPREMEEALGERGLSRSDRTKAASLFRDWLQREAGGPEPGPRDAGADALLEAIRSATSVLRT